MIDRLILIIVHLNHVIIDFSVIENKFCGTFCYVYFVNIMDARVELNLLNHHRTLISNE